MKCPHCGSKNYIQNVHLYYLYPNKVQCMECGELYEKEENK